VKTLFTKIGAKSLGDLRSSVRGQKKALKGKIETFTIFVFQEYGATSSSGNENSPRNRGTLSQLQHCRVELTPGHYPRPASSTLNANGALRSVQSSNNQCQHLEDEDLIQKVSELGLNHFVGDVRHAKKTPTKNGNKSNRRDKRQKQDENLTAMQLAILVKEKLHKESINLGVAPFTTKVRTVCLRCISISKHERDPSSIRKDTNFFLPK